MNSVMEIGEKIIFLEDGYKGMGRIESKISLKLIMNLL